VSSISIACLRGMLRDSATMGVEQNQADIDAGGGEALRPRRRPRDRSSPRVWQPAAVAMPCTAATTGFGRSTTACIIALQAFMILPEIGTAAIGIAAARGQFLHVVARGEGRTVGRDDDGADAVVVVDLLQRAVQLSDQALRQAVARRRPVEGEDADAADIFLQQDRRLQRGRASSLAGISEVSTPRFSFWLCDT